MCEFCINIIKSDCAIYTYIYGKLIQKFDNYNIIITNISQNDCISILISCEKINRQRVVSIIKNVICESICIFYKKEYITKNINFTNLSLSYKIPLIQALTDFDLGTDYYMAERNISIGEGNIDLRGIYYFKLKSLRDKWNELILIYNENSSFFAIDEYVVDFLRFLIENLEYKYEAVNMIVVNNNSIKLYDSDDNILGENFSNNNIIENLIICNPQQLNIYNFDKLEHDMIDKIDKIFNKKVNYINKEYLESEKFMI